MPSNALKQHSNTQVPSNALKQALKCPQTLNCMLLNALKHILKYSNAHKYSNALKQHEHTQMPPNALKQVLKHALKCPQTNTQMQYHAILKCNLCNAYSHSNATQTCPQCLNCMLLNALKTSLKGLNPKRHSPSRASTQAHQKNNTDHSPWPQGRLGPQTSVCAP